MCQSILSSPLPNPSFLDFLSDLLSISQRRSISCSYLTSLHISSNSQVRKQQHSHTYTHTHRANLANLRWLQASGAFSIYNRRCSSTVQSHAALSCKLNSNVLCLLRQKQCCLILLPLLSPDSSPVKSKTISYITGYFHEQ